MLPILNQSLWRDEAFSILLAGKNPLDIIRLTMHDVQPPLYYIFLHYWIAIFGNNEVVLRSFSFFLHLLTVLVIFFIARKLIKSTIAQVAIAFAALLNPFLLQYAFEGTGYTLLAFLTVLAVYLVVIKRYLAASIVLAMGILTHNFGVFNFFAFGVWWLFANRNDLKNKAIQNDAVMFLAFPIASIIIWGTVMWHQWVQVSQGFWITQTTSSIFLHSFEMYSRGDLNYLVQPMIYTITTVLCFFAFSYWINRDKKEEETKIPSLLFFVFLIPVLITYVISSLFTPIYHERHLIAADPMLILLIGYSLWKVYEANTQLRMILVAFIAIYIMLLVQGSEQIVATSTKPAINYGVSQILSKAQTGDVVIPQSNLNFLETKWYVQKNGGTIPVYAYVPPGGSIPFYIGSVLFEPQEIITQMPKSTRVWQIKGDGGYELLKQ